MIMSQVTICKFESDIYLYKGKEDGIVELDKISTFFPILAHSRAGGASSRGWRGVGL